MKVIKNQIKTFVFFILKGLFTRESDFALGQPIILNMKIIISCKTDYLTAKSRSEIGRVNKPLVMTKLINIIGMNFGHTLLIKFKLQSQPQISKEKQIAQVFLCALYQ